MLNKDQKFIGSNRIINEIETNKNGIKIIIKRIHELSKDEMNFQEIEKLQKNILRLEQKNQQLEKNYNYIWN